MAVKKTTNSNLDALRQKIDELDSQLLAVLEERMSIVQDIADAKRDAGETGLAFRPGREASVLRRILERHSSDLPDEVVARIWREMISAVSRLQAPFSVAVVAPEKSVGYWDMARSHFGSATPMKLHKTTSVVLRDMSDDMSMLAVLPWQSLERDTWWVHLAQGGRDNPRVLAKLPFLGANSGGFEDLNALVLGHAEPEPSGNDITLMVVTTTGEVSRARLSDLMAKAKISGKCMDSISPAVEEGDWLHLVEISDFLNEQDPRVAKLEKYIGEGLIKIVVLGAYAVPIEPKISS
jgi:chorismate mutase / prephenate dehydratase